MGKVQHTVTGCVPVDRAALEAYLAIVQTNENVSHEEELRNGAEAARQAAETTRQSNEEVRQLAEGTRTQQFEALKDDMQEAIGQAGAAATAAIGAADSAAQTESEIKAAEASRVTAEQGRVTAEQERASAEQGRVSAESARVTAETARETQAGTDHTRAESDHTRAGADHTQAGSDHARADSDHTQASADHTQAESDHTVVEGYDTRLTNVESGVSQLGQEVSRNKTVSIIRSFLDSDIITGKYVNSSGEIGSSSQRYRLVKMHLAAGKYRFLNNGWSENFGLWKYSDSEYSQDATKITISAYDEDLALTDAYYILYWYSASPDATIIPNEFVAYNMDYTTNIISDSCDLITSFGVFDKITPSAIIDIPAQNGYRYSFPIKNGYTYIFYYISGSGNTSIRAGKVDKTTVELFGSISSSSKRHEYTATDDYIFLQFNASTTLKIGVYRLESIEGRLFHQEEQNTKITNDILQNEKFIGNFFELNETAEVPFSWDKTGAFLPAGTYAVTAIGKTSVNFKDVNGDSVGSIGNLNNATVEYTISGDAVRVSGYCAALGSNGNLELTIVRKDSLANRVINLEIETEAFQPKSIKRFSDIDGDYKHIYLAPAAGTYVGSWLYLHTFLPGTYLVTNAEGSYTSFVFKDKDGNELYRAGSLSRGVTTIVELNTTAESVSGYSSTIDSVINVEVVKKGTIEQRLEVLEKEQDICVLNPACIYDNLIDNNVRSRRIDGATKKIFSLVHFSDIHGLDANVERLNRFLEKYVGKFDDIICTGDIVSDVFTDTNILAGQQYFLVAIGNHDAWVRTYDADIVERQEADNIWVVKQKYCYDKFIAPNVDDWGVTQPTGASENGLCYYYKDYSSGASKLRVIVLDCMHYNIGADLDLNNNSIQNAWLESVLSDARTNSIPVVIANHYWPKWVDISNPEVIKCSYTNTDEISGDYLPTIAIDSVQGFIDAGVEFVCWIVGHSHMDVIASPRDYPKQVFISIDCATYINSIGNSARIRNTKSQDCVNIVSFDTNDKLVKVVRVGSDTTRQLKQKRVLTYRYAPFTDAAGVSHNIGLEISE